MQLTTEEKANTYLHLKNKAVEISTNMTYHCLPLQETSYKKMTKPCTDQKEHMWTAGCDFIKRSATNELDMNFNKLNLNNDSVSKKESEATDKTDGACVKKRSGSSSDLALSEEPKTISEEEDEMLLKRFRNQGRRNAICEMNTNERNGFPRVLKHYIHLKTFQKCGLG